MPHNRGPGGGFPGSRDYCLPTIPCAVRECPCNKLGKCEVPSAIKIGSDGRCEMGVKARKALRKGKT